jgi:hypothetical protein
MFRKVKEAIKKDQGFKISNFLIGLCLMILAPLQYQEILAVKRISWFDIATVIILEIGGILLFLSAIWGNLKKMKEQHGRK